MSPILYAAAALLPIGAVCGYITLLRRRLSAAMFDATHDPLTGLHNRRVLYPALATAIEKGRPVAVVIFDVDRFKTVNDRYGHPAGDTVLATLAHRLSALDLGLLLRLGGDEFAAIMPGGSDHALAVAHIVWQTVAGAPFTLPDGQQITVWVSVGVAAHRPGIDSAGLLRHADAALARAKTSGGVAAWHPDTPPQSGRARRHPGDRRGTTRWAPPGSDPAQVWRCWFDAGDLAPLADHATITRHHMRTDGEDELVRDCPGGLAITADGDQVTACSTGWPPPLFDPYDPDRVRMAHATDTDPPPDGPDEPVVAHMHLDPEAVDAIHTAADWGGLLEVTVVGDTAAFTLTRP